MAMLFGRKPIRKTVFPAEPKCYGKESPIIVNLVPYGTNMKINQEIGKSVGDRFAIKF
jgi:hypothetical protein